MTTSIFPADKTQPFVADNGVTYVYEADRWRVKQYKLDDAALEDYATEEWTEEKIAEAMLDGTVDLTSYATKTYSDAEDDKLQNQIDELSVSKGKVARYTCSSITGGFASRPGQLAFNSGDPTAVNQISFGTEDSDNVLTKPMADGDIIEFVDSLSNTVSRYKITDASGAPTGVEVEYISGTNNFTVGEEEQVYIYPQNEAGASKDYVDNGLARKLNNTGANDLIDDTDWKIRQHHADGSNKTMLQIKNGELGVYNLKEPSQSHHAATRSYVDTEVRHAGGITATRPPGLRFQYKSGSSIPPSGKFGFFTDVGEKRLMLSTTSLDYAWGSDMPRKDIAYDEGHMFTIWTVQSGKWKMKLTGTLDRIDLHSDRLYSFVSYATDVNGTWSTTASYYITISGMF